MPGASSAAALRRLFTSTACPWMQNIQIKPIVSQARRPRYPKLLKRKTSFFASERIISHSLPKITTGREIKKQQQPPPHWKRGSTRRPDAKRKGALSQNLVCTQLLDFLLLLPVNEPVSGWKSPIAGNNMIHCAVIRDWSWWKETSCSLTGVTHRDIQILSKCRQASWSR